MNFQLPDGQLYTCERELLHAAVLRCRPALALEVGTWSGGGSTYQIVSALTVLGHGHLHTCEIDPERFVVASALYAQEPLKNHCTTYLMPSRELITKMLKEWGPPDFIFFDGSENPQEAMDDFAALDAHVKPGTVFMMHDWLTRDSKKADLLRPHLTASKHWKIVKLLQPPESVGLVEAVKL